jgi:hypothetical protein
VASFAAMPLSEEAFTLLVDAGCPDCRNKRLAIEALVTQTVPLLGGEPFGAPSWGYKGEDLVRGTYRIACDGCKKELFAASACPRGDAAGGIDRALAQENAFRLPKACRTCGSERLTATAFVPALVIYEGKRTNKGRAQAAPEEPGFHATRVECTHCHDVVERPTPCPLCG